MADLADNVKTEVSTDLAALKSQAVKLHLTTLAVAILLVAVMVFVVMRVNDSFAKAMGAAESREAVFQQQVTDLRKTLTEGEEKRAATDKQVTAITTGVNTRNQNVDAQISAMTSAVMSISQVASASKTVLNQTPAEVDDTTISYTAPQVQDFVATKLDRDRLKLNLDDTDKALDLTKQNALSCSNDLDEAKTVLTSCEATVAAYKKVAVKSRWQKFKSVAGKVGLVAAGIGAGVLVETIRK